MSATPVYTSSATVVTPFNANSAKVTNKTVKSGKNIHLGENLKITNTTDGSGSIATSLPISSLSTVSANALNIGLNDDASQAYVTISNTGNILTDGIITSTKYIAATLDITASRNIYSATSYSTYKGSTNNDIVVNKEVLEQVVLDITGSSSTTIAALQELLKAFNTEDESILNAVLKIQTEINNKLLTKIDTLYHYLLRDVSANLTLKDLYGSPAAGQTVSDIANATIVDGEYKLTIPDVFITPVLDITSSITGTGASARGPGLTQIVDVNTSGTDATDILTNVTSDAPVTTTTGTA
jgi:hypothetical protein